MLTEKKFDENKTFNQLKKNDLKNHEKTEFANDVAHLLVSQAAKEISREREDKEYLQAHLKIQERDFETFQNNENEETKKRIQSIIDLSGLWLKSNVNITPNDWIREERIMANQLKIPDNVKQNVIEIMKPKNQKINNLDGGSNDVNSDYDYDDDNDDDVNDEIEDRRKII